MATKTFYFERVFAGAKKDGRELFPPHGKDRLHFYRGVAAVTPKNKDEEATIQAFVDAKEWPLGDAYIHVKQAPKRETSDAPETYAALTSEVMQKDKGWLTFNEAKTLLGCNPKKLKDLIEAKAIGTMDSDGKALYNEADCERVKAGGLPQ